MAQMIAVTTLLANWTLASTNCVLVFKHELNNKQIIFANKFLLASYIQVSIKVSYICKRIQKKQKDNDKNDKQQRSYYEFSKLVNPWIMDLERTRRKVLKHI